MARCNDITFPEWLPFAELDSEPPDVFSELASSCLDDVPASYQSMNNPLPTLPSAVNARNTLVPARSQATTYHDAILSRPSFCSGNNDEQDSLSPQHYLNALETGQDQQMFATSLLSPEITPPLPPRSNLQQDLRHEPFPSAYSDVGSAAPCLSSMQAANQQLNPSFTPPVNAPINTVQARTWLKEEGNSIPSFNQQSRSVPSMEVQSSQLPPSLEDCQMLLRALQEKISSSHPPEAITTQALLNHAAASAASVDRTKNKPRRNSIAGMADLQHTSRMLQNQWLAVQSLMRSAASENERISLEHEQHQPVARLSSTSSQAQRSFSVPPGVAQSAEPISQSVVRNSSTSLSSSMSPMTLFFAEDAAQDARTWSQSQSLMSSPYSTTSSQSPLSFAPSPDSQALFGSSSSQLDLPSFQHIAMKDDDVVDKTSPAYKRTRQLARAAARKRRIRQVETSRQLALRLELAGRRQQKLEATKLELLAELGRLHQRVREARLAVAHAHTPTDVVKP